MADPISETILKRLKEGNTKAFEQIFLTYYSKVRNFIAAIIKSEKDAEDITQDIFEKLWITHEAIDTQKSLNSYIYTFARNAAFNYLKHQNVCKAYVTENSCHDLDISPEDMIYAKEIGLLIEMAVAGMSDQQRRIYQLSRNKGLTNDEISAQLKISKKTVENQLSIIIQKLRKLISAFLTLVA